MNKYFYEIIETTKYSGTISLKKSDFQFLDSLDNETAGNLILAITGRDIFKSRYIEDIAELEKVTQAINPSKKVPKTSKKLTKLYKEYIDKKLLI